MRWDGQTWKRIGTTVSGDVRALAIFDDGAGGGPALYAAGTFTQASNDGIPFDILRFARWDGAAWHEVGGGNALPRLNGGLDRTD